MLTVISGMRSKVSILDQNGAVLNENTYKDKVEIKGSIWIGPMAAFKDKLPQIHHDLMKKMIRENSQVIDVLR